jgi:hypothetical protein
VFEERSYRELCVAKLLAMKRAGGNLFSRGVFKDMSCGEDVFSGRAKKDEACREQFV